MSVRRRIVLLITCLVLGAVLNVAVAWGCCLWWQPGPAARNVQFSPDDVAATWKRFAASDWPENPNDIWFQSTDGANTLTLARFRESGATYAMVVFGSGWPYQALEGALTTDPLTKGRRRALQLHFDMPGTSVKMLPIGPAFPGFLLNLFLYAALVWLLIRGPAEARRRWREHKGRCGTCGYPRGTSSVCTECGADLSRAWGRRFSAHALANPPGGAGG